MELSSRDYQESPRNTFEWTDWSAQNRENKKNIVQKYGLKNEEEVIKFLEQKKISGQEFEDLEYLVNQDWGYGNYYETKKINDRIDSMMGPYTPTVMDQKRSGKPRIVEMSQFTLQGSTPLVDSKLIIPKTKIKIKSKHFP